MTIRILVLLTLLPVSAFANGVPIARVPYQGQEYQGFEYRIDFQTGAGSALLKMREATIEPGPCPGPRCNPVVRYKDVSREVPVPGLEYDSAAQRIVFQDDSTGYFTVCATTEERRRWRRRTVVIHPTKRCTVKAVREDRWLVIYFRGES